MIGGAVAAAGTSPVVGSTGSTTFVLVVLLLALGVAMVVVAVWLVRSTRSDVPALAPLEVMGDRGFAKAEPDDRSATLTAVRPQGAPPPAPMIPIEDDAADEPPPPDEVPDQCQRLEETPVGEES